MANETEQKSPNGWSLDTLERFLSDKIAALDRFCVTNFAQVKERTDMALAASDKAVSKAEIATEKRFEGVNEFRATLSDQSATLLPRNEYSVQYRALEQRIAIVTAEMADLKSSARGKTEGIGNILAVSGAIFSAIISVGTLIVLIIERH